MNDTVRVADHILCVPCCNQALADKAAPRPALERQLDPTVCVNCRQDAGATELPKVAGLPVCASCETLFRNRPFPMWIKASLAAVLVLVVVSLVWNLRFFQAYVALKRFVACSQQGNVGGAAAQMSAASAYVPESPDLRSLATFFEGVDLLRQNKCAEALARLTQCRDKVPPAYGVETLILQAQGGAAFDAQDYDGFLEAAQLLDRQTPSHYFNKATLASALACKYAQTGDAGFRTRSLECLDQARTMSNGAPEFAEYETRIRHRLASGEIITSEEFHQRFPNGWTEKEEE
jgi:hypothetical protein